MTSGVEQHQQHRRLLVALVVAVLAVVVGVGVGVDAHASSSRGQVAGTRVAAHELLAGPVVAASEDVLAGEGRRTTTGAADLVVGSRVAPNTASGGLRTVADEIGEVRSYPSYRKAQADLGTSPTSDIHHIVEQCQCSAARSGFSVSRVNSTDNLIRLTGDVHDRISAFYSSRPPGFSTTVRNTLNGMPFEQQYDFGLDVIRRAMGGSL
ncbi:MAG: hypothetical protein KY439_01160 [Actinobacteria bacterium]|nr:hypothetical protein [Actinomycetota bacterium]